MPDDERDLSYATLGTRARAAAEVARAHRAQELAETVNESTMRLIKALRRTGIVDLDKGGDYRVYSDAKGQAYLALKPEPLVLAVGSWALEATRVCPFCGRLETGAQAIESLEQLAPYLLGERAVVSCHDGEEPAPPDPAEDPGARLLQALDGYIAHLLESAG